MSLRETLNKNPALTTGATAVIVIVALGYIVWSLMGSDPSRRPEAAYFTTDDGANYFGGTDKQMAPFDVDGKEAVRAYLFTCDDGANKFVGYMTRYNPDIKKKYEEARAAAEAAAGQGRQPTKAELGNVMNMGRQLGESLEWKLPGSEAKWARLPGGTNAAAAVKCPDGSQTNLKAVEPDGTLSEVATRDFSAAPTK